MKEVSCSNGDTMDLCLRCGGMFFEFDEMRSMLSDKISEVFPDRFHGDNSPDHTEPYICPKCSGNMREEEYAYVSGIHIDRCADCNSIFLNGGEIQDINRYLSSIESNATDERKKQEIEQEYENKWLKIAEDMYRKLRNDGRI